jgi:hypothetical protein
MICPTIATLRTGRQSLRRFEQCGIMRATCRVGRYSHLVWPSGRMLNRTEKVTRPEGFYL